MKKVRLNNLIKLLLLLIFAVAIVGCSSNSDSKNIDNEVKEETGEPQKGGEAIIAYQSDATTFDPILSSSGSDIALFYPIYDRLITYSKDLEPEPGLAESWEFQDEKTLILHLREGVTFHDGTEFDAEAVKFNIDRVNSEDSFVPDLNSVERVEVVDKKTVKLHLKEPDSSILMALSDKGGMIVSPTAVKEYGEDFSRNPVGTGPFKFTNHVPNGEIVYEANEDYWQEGKPYLDKMTIKVMAEENARINALKSGEVDFASVISPANVENLKSDSNIILKDVLSLQFKTIFLNKSIPPFDNKNIRLAVQHGINREAFAQGVSFGLGKPANSIFPKDYWAADPDLTIDYDPEKAKQLVKESGLEDVSFEMIHFPIGDYARGAEVIKSQLEEIGIEVKLQPMEIAKGTDSFFSEQTAPAFSTLWMGRPDPQITVNLLFSADSYLNPGKYSTTEIESLILKAASTYEQDERAELYKKIAKKGLLEEGMVIPLVYEPLTDAMHKKIKGYEPDLVGKVNLTEIWIED